MLLGWTRMLVLLLLGSDLTLRSTKPAAMRLSWVEGVAIGGYTEREGSFARGAGESRFLFSTDTTTSVLWACLIALFNWNNEKRRTRREELCEIGISEVKCIHFLVIRRKSYNIITIDRSTYSNGWFGNALIQRRDNRFDFLIDPAGLASHIFLELVIPRVHSVDHVAIHCWWIK